MSLFILDYCFSVHELKIYMTWMLDYMYMYACPILSLECLAVCNEHIEVSVVALGVLLLREAIVL